MEQATKHDVWEAALIVCSVAAAPHWAGYAFLSMAIISMVSRWILQRLLKNEKEQEV